MCFNGVVREKIISQQECLSGRILSSARLLYGYTTALDVQKRGIQLGYKLAERCELGLVLRVVRAK